MGFFYYALMICFGFVILEALIIITVNSQRGYWELVNWMHLLSTIFYPVYLGSVVYATKTRDRSHGYCDAVWKVSSTLYIALTMAVYLFYYARTKIWEVIKWEGKERLERLAVVGIAAMGITGLGFFWLPIRGIQYNAFLIDGECAPVRRRWIPVCWMVGDTAVSALLLVLFIRPLAEIRKMLGKSPRSIALLLNMRRLIQKNRNLLAFTVLVTLVVMVTVAVSDLTLEIVHYMCVFDRFITVQCITLTFSYDSQECFYCHACLFLSCGDPNKSEHEEVSMTDKKAPSIIHMSPKLQSESPRKKPVLHRFDLGSVV